MRTSMWAVTALAGLALVEACSSADRGNEANRIVIGVQPFVTSAPFFLAEAEGFFADEGLEVELVRVPSGEHGLAQLVSGKSDVFSGFPGPGLLNLVGRGADIRIVADRGYLDAGGCDYYALLARSEITSRSIETLVGRTIRLDPAMPSYWLDQLLSPAGYSIGDMKIVDFPPSGTYDAFDNGAIDFALIGDPFKINLTRSGVAYVWASAKDWVPDSQFSMVLYGSRLLRDEPQTGERFMVAYLRGVRQYSLGPTERNLEILTVALDQSRQLLESSCWLPMRPDGMPDLDFLEGFQKWAIDRGLVDQEIQVEQIWDPRFVEYAQQVGLPVRAGS